MLDKLLTEQSNPASASIDTLPTEQALRIINAEDQKVAAAVEREIPAIARAVDAIVSALEKGGRLVLPWRRHQRPARRPRRIGDPSHLQRAARNGAGHHGRRRIGAQPRHRNHRRRSRYRCARSFRARIHGKRRAGRNRGERENALCARSRGRSEKAGSGHGRNLLHPRCGTVARRGFCDRAAGRSGDRRRQHAHEGRHGAESWS